MTQITAIEFTCGHCSAENELPFNSVLKLKKTTCGKCNKELFSFFEKPLKSLDYKSYVHPIDKKTLSALHNIPGVDSILKALIRHSFELSTRIYHQANFIRVSTKQFPSLYKNFIFAAKILDIKDLPELYVYQDDTPNAYTFGVDKCFIAISTGCIDLMNEQELLCILSHELGHVHCEHVLYKSASKIFGNLASQIAQKTLGIGNLVTYPIQLALAKWDRASELSSDRAALLVVKNPSIVISTLMKLAGGNKKLDHELNIDEFIKQSQDLQNMEKETPFGKYATVLNSVFRSHPFPIWRAKEIITWVSTGNYLEIIDGDYKKQKKPSKTSKINKEKDTAFDFIDEKMDHLKSWYKNTFTMNDKNNT